MELLHYYYSQTYPKIIQGIGEEEGELISMVGCECDDGDHIQRALRHSADWR